MAIEKIIGATAIAEYFGCCESTIMRWITDRDFQARKNKEAVWVISKRQANLFKEAHPELFKVREYVPEPKNVENRRW